MGTQCEHDVYDMMENEAPNTMAHCGMQLSLLTRVCNNI